MPRVVPSQVVRYIDHAFPKWTSNDTEKAANLDYTHSGRVSAIVSLAERVPDHLLVLGVQEYADFIASIEVLRSCLPMWQQHGSSFQPRSGEPVRAIRRLLAKCPDEHPSPSTHELAFVTDPELRADLRLDIAAVNQALVNGEWKAATVLAGGAVEALLLWRLLQVDSKEIAAAEAKLKRKSRPLLEWDLHGFIEVATICPDPNPLIRPETAIQLRLAKDFRNLIHPGRAIRLSQRCSRATALAAIAGLEMVVGDLAT
jgi:hypothetical protein